MKKVSWFISLFICLGLIGCGSNSGSIGSILMASLGTAFTPKGRPIWLEEVEFQQDSNINNHSPVEIHLLIVYDKRAWDSIMKLNSQQYFEKSEQIIQRFQDSIQLYSWVIIPGVDTLPMTIEPNQMFAVGIVVFARYQTVGDHRKIIGNSSIALIHLKQNDFEIQSVQSGDGDDE